MVDGLLIKDKNNTNILREPVEVPLICIIKIKLLSVLWKILFRDFSHMGCEIV